jgi:serine/threonine protein kinase
MVHRDLSASNVLLTTAGGDERGFRALLSDFGLSTVLSVEQTHRTSQVKGTISYMSPELFIQDSVSPALDIYSLGVVMYLMWAGKDPYANKTAARVIMLKVGRLPGRLQLVQTASPASMPGRWRGSDRAGGGALGGSHARGQATPSGAAVHWVQVKAHSRLPPLEGCPAEYQQLVDDCTRYDRHSRPTAAQVVQRLEALLLHA